MKIGGVEVQGPAEDILVLPRSNGDIVFKARAATRMDEFSRFVPMPLAKKAWSKEKGNHFVTDDPEYKSQMTRYNELQFAFMALQSLEPSDIEWSRVKLDQVNTWTEWSIELQDAGFTDIEIRRIVGLIMSVNSLDDRKLQQAREDFLRGQAEAAGDPSGPVDGQPSLESGTPASE